MRLDHTLAILERTPATLRAMLAGLDDGIVRANYGQGTFSPFDVLAHLVHGEHVDWVPRTEHILAGRATTPFEPYVIEESRAVGQGKTPDDLLDEFATLRRRNLERVRAIGLTPDHLAMRGTHPALGPVTLANLLAAWAAHDLHHTAQICKGLAWQGEGDVGPWREFIGIIDQARRASSRSPGGGEGE